MMMSEREEIGKLPFELSDMQDSEGNYIVIRGSWIKARCSLKVDAQFIVKACNSYYENQQLLAEKDKSIAELLECLKQCSYRNREVDYYYLEQLLTKYDDK